MVHECYMLHELLLALSCAWSINVTCYMNYYYLSVRGTRMLPELIFKPSVHVRKLLPIQTNPTIYDLMTSFLLIYYSIYVYQAFSSASCKADQYIYIRRQVGTHANMSGSLLLLSISALRTS